MPVQPTYPGVYIEEIPSGVRTITGVSTSVAAFVGSAKRGPINRAVHILSYADFERAFGGLDAGSEMSYGVRQFFLNGGTDAWVVRLAKGAVAASLGLDTDAGQPSLKITALEDGLIGNFVQVRVDRQTANPASTFNLTLISASPDNPGDARTERFENLSMNSTDARYVLGALAIRGWSRSSGRRAWRGWERGRAPAAAWTTWRLRESSTPPTTSSWSRSTGWSR